MTRGKKLIILLAVFIIIAALALIITKMGYNAEDSSDSSVALNFINTDNLTEISWLYGETSYDLKKSESGWKNANDDGINVNTTYLDEILGKLDDLSAVKVIEGEEAENLSQFGLDYPECSVTLTTGEKSSKLLFGAENDIGGQRYISIGDGKVYLIDSELLTSFECEQGDIFETEDNSGTEEDTTSDTEAENETYVETDDDSE